MDMNREQLEELIDETVRRTLTTLGVDTKDPLEMQADFQHLRDWRITTESIRKKGFLTMIGLFVAGLSGLVWIGIKQIVSGIS